MKVNCRILILLFIIISNYSFSQFKESLIIDTDAGTDDYRAIILMLSLKQFDVKAITLSDGTLFPDKGAWRVENLLKCFNKEEIIIGVGKKTMYNKPIWRKYAETVPWSSCSKEMPIKISYPQAKDVITNVLSTAKDKSVTIVCLGSLSNVYETLKENSSLTEKIKVLIWYNSSDIQHSTNYVFEPKAANFVLNLNIPIRLIQTIKDKSLSYSSHFVKQISQVQTKYAKEIIYQMEYFYKHSDTTHLRFWDELCALYIANPDFFSMKENVKEPRIQFAYDYEIEKLKKLYIQILNETYRPRQHVVFSIFPTDSIYYADDVNQIKNKIISKYGEEEFMLGTIASEIHNHLGIYTILGVKMGLYAREILNVPKNQIKVVSYAGNVQPLSCLNDGIMVATGSTPAYGLFAVNDSIIVPTAMFCYKSKCIKLTLKKEVHEMIHKQIQDAVYTFTISSSEYWKTIRKLALQHWDSLDRNKIFDIEIR